MLSKMVFFCPLKNSLRSKVLLEELKGSTMTSEALSKIGSFIPR